MQVEKAAGAGLRQLQGSGSRGRVPNDTSPFRYINPFINLPAACRTDGTLCGSILTRNGPCPVKHDRGCLLLTNRAFRLVTEEKVPA